MELWLGIVVIVTLVLLNGFFVASGYALVAVRRSRVDQLVAEGNPLARPLRQAIDNLDVHVATAQLGSAMASIALGFVGEPALASAIAPAIAGLPPPIGQAGASTFSILIAFLAITSLSIVFGELTPKTLALQRSERVALVIAEPTIIFRYIFSPMIWALNGLGNTVLGLLGLRADEGEELVHSVEELKLLVAASEEAGVLEEVEEELVGRALEFGERRVHEIMVPRLEMTALPADTDLDTAIRRAAESGFTRIPVYEDSIDNVTGIVHLREMVLAHLAADQHPEKRPIAVGAVARPALYVPEQITVASALATMRQQGRPMAIVIDEHGGTAGLVTISDIVEEVFGAMEGEFGAPRVLIRHLPDGTALIDGLTPIEDVNDTFQLDIEDPNNDTIGGFVTGQLGRIPEVGDVVHYHGCTFRVESLARRRVGSLRLRCSR